MGFSEMLSLLVPLFHLVLPPVVLHPTTQPFSTGCFLSTSSFCSASFSPHRRSRWTPERNARDEQTVPLKRLSGLLGAAQPAKGFQNDFPPEGDLEEPTDEQKKVVVRRCSIRCPHCDKRCRRGSEFCSSCGAAVAAVNSDKMSLVDFVNDTFWPVRTSEVAHHTARVERGFWDQILPAIGQTPLSRLTALIWECYLKTLKLRGCSARTQTLHQLAYSAALKYALHLGHIKEKHPLRTIKGSTKRTLKTVPLTAGEVLRLLECASRPMHKALFGVCVGIGLRPSEVLRMRWEDIHLRDGTVVVRGTKTSNSLNRIPVTELTQTALEKWWAREGRPTSGLCFYRKRRKNVGDGTCLKAPLASFRGPLMAASLR
eukprot:GHVS01077517.1.p1 GENE.GHVS01077517.1~~GHVS01077517.1.p1  ORF type:complete len:372 (-),score=36.02 GHVS01077517.1:479-1594(-)